MISYDSITLSYADAAICQCPERFMRILCQPKTVIDADGVVASIYGHLRNIKVSITQAGLHLTGSIAKYINGNNLDSITVDEVKDAFNELSDTFEIDIGKSNVTRIDLAANIELANPVTDYLSVLGNSSRLERSFCGNNTLYYQSQSMAKIKPKTLIFYDKVAEMKKELPAKYIGKNILRYEMRLNGRLPQRFSLPTVTANTLTDKVFFHNVSDLWLTEYEAIHKKSNIDISYQPKTVAEGERMFAAYALSELSEDKYNDFLTALSFDHPEYNSRFRRKVSQLRYSNYATESGGLSEELTSKIIEQRECSP